MTYWDPATGTYKDGDPPPGYQAPGYDAKPGPSTAVPDRGNADPRQWGGYGRAIGSDGKPIVGTSGGERDVARYRGMAKPTNTTPIIDQTRSDETRGIQDRALGYMGRASTGQDSLARALGQQQTAAAVNATKSLAQTVRGGPMMRSAAMRAAGQNQGALEARGRLATEAAAANEAAGARGAYAGALAGQRAQDLGVATSQAGLELGQRGADDQREGFYEGLGWDTANTQLETGLGVSRSDQAAGQAQRNAAQSAIDAANRSTQDTIGTAVAGASGLMQGAAKVARPPQPDDKYGTTSDIKAKTDIAPVEALSGKSTRGHYIRTSLTDDAPKPTYGYLDDHTEAPGWLVGYMNSREQEPMISDDKTKLAKAWDEGHAAAIADVEKASRATPEEIKQRSEGDSYSPAHAAVRGIKARAWDEGNKEGEVSARMAATRQKLQRDFDAAGETPPAVPPPPPEPVAQPGYVSQILGRARAMMPSDERTKESKGYVPGAMADAMRSMKPSVYEYKPEYAGRAGQDVGEKNVGPMANPMAKDPIASTAIDRQPDGMLAIDKDKALKLSLGGLADLQMQIDDLKRKRGKAA